jgi:hypothetical protein
VAGTGAAALPSNPANRSSTGRPDLVRPRPWQLAALVAALAAAAAAGHLPGGTGERTVVVTMHHSRFQPA